MNKHLHSGFTLVELAISLTVIGLLIGGILKGQELMENAKVTQTIRQINGYESAVAVFKNSYGALPGDMFQPGQRLPDCTGTPCITGGNNNGYISNGGFYTEESRNFWLHMSKAGVIKGVDSTLETSSANTDAWLSAFPQSPLETSYFMIFSNTGAFGAGYESFAATNTLRLIPPVYTGPPGGAMKASAAARLDFKMDDGNPFAGSVLGVNSVSTANCGTSATKTYNENTEGALCNSIVLMDL